MKKELPDDLLSALQEFAQIYGDNWKRVMRQFHWGQVDEKGEHLVSHVRRIRNNHTANPNDLEGLIHEETNQTNQETTPGNTP